MKNWINKVLTPVLTYAGILAGILILHNVLMDVFGLTFSGYNQIAGTVLPLIGIVIAIYAYRKEHSPRQLSYGKAVGIGILVAFACGVLISAYSVINMTYINTDFKEMTLQMLEEKMIERGASDDLIEMMVARQEKALEPVRMFIFSTVAISLLGLITSLIAAVFIKKEEVNPFNDIEVE